MDHPHSAEGGSGPGSRSRRRFIQHTATAAAGAAVLASTARSYGRILGANDRIQIGQIGCSDRAIGLRKMLKGTAETFDSNFDLRSVCDIWSVNREKGASHAEELFGRRPETYKYSEDLLADEELDAVMVATGDHQHARILAEVALAGKDAYCEKPMANTLDDARLARAAVRESGCVAQMGSQWLSCPYQQRVREIIRSGRLGKITKIEQSWNFNGPRWRLPGDPDIAAIREEDTDWKRWLLGRPWRPFDARAYFEFRIYSDFSGGITDQWYSHGSGLAHFYLDSFIPDDTVANGGIFVWHDERENPDTLQCLSTFREKEVLYSYCSSYGNGHGDHTVIRGTEGTLYSPGGEGSPRWYFVPEARSAWGSNVHFDRRAETDPEPELVRPVDREDEVPPVSQDDNLKAHTDNWLSCLRTRKTPNGSIDSGFAHSVAVVMATRSYREGKKLYWDREKEEIVEQLPAPHGLEGRG